MSGVFDLVISPPRYQCVSSKSHGQFDMNSILETSAIIYKTASQHQESLTAANLVTYTTYHRHRLSWGRGQHITRGSRSHAHLALQRARHYLTSV